jgi:hypothetical protein
MGRDLRPLRRIAMGPNATTTGHSNANSQPKCFEGRISGRRDNSSFSSVTRVGDIDRGTLECRPRVGCALARRLALAVEVG